MWRHFRYPHCNSAPTRKTPFFQPLFHIRNLRGQGFNIAPRPLAQQTSRHGGPADLAHIIRTMQDTKLVVVESFGNRPQAELAKGALAEAGIEAIIQADTVGGMREHLAWSGAGFKILVREDDATFARDVLTSTAEGDE